MIFVILCLWQFFLTNEINDNKKRKIWMYEMNEKRIKSNKNLNFLTESRVK